MIGKIKYAPGTIASLMTCLLFLLLINIINIIAQKPKIKKYSRKMILKISKLCEINPNQINIKGKTTEKLGLIGKQKAIASEVITSVTSND